MIIIMNLYTEKDIEKMKLAGKLAGEALKDVCSKIEIGMRTEDIDNLFVKFLHGTGGKAACLGYSGFPKNLCVSVNNQACHGIPGSRIVQDGDVVSVDLVVELDGYHGDTCSTVGIGNISYKHQKLIEVAKKALDAGIHAIKSNELLSRVGFAVEKAVNGTGFEIVTDYCGHGIGKKMHEQPLILHYNHMTSKRFANGMCFTIEPIISAGKGNTYVDDQDEWTVWTKDKSYCAQFEHTICLWNDQVEILTVVNE